MFYLMTHSTHFTWNKTRESTEYTSLQCNDLLQSSLNQHPPPLKKKKNTPKNPKRKHPNKHPPPKKKKTHQTNNNKKKKKNKTKQKNKKKNSYLIVGIKRKEMKGMFVLFNNALNIFHLVDLQLQWHETYGKGLISERATTLWVIF